MERRIRREATVRCEKGPIAICAPTLLGPRMIVRAKQALAPRPSRSAYCISGA
jgi:hypothetical protein